MVLLIKQLQEIQHLQGGGVKMPTTVGVIYIIAVTILFALWIYGLVSLYFDLRYRYLPAVYSWLRQRNEDDDRHSHL